MIFAGADPGLRGAMAALDAAGHVLRLGPTPIREGANGRDEYDVDSIARILRNLATIDSVVLTVEQLRALPPFRENKAGEKVPLGGYQTNLHRGESRGWRWMAAGLRAGGAAVSCVMVEPRTWQAEMVKGMPGASPKERSVRLAKLLFPGVSLLRTPRSRVEDDGIAEALLLAELGRRRALGGALFAQRAGVQSAP